MFKEEKATAAEKKMEATPSPSDGELAQRAKKGDERAFAELYRRHAPALLSRLRRMLGSLQVAEEVLQELFLNVFGALDRYDDQRPFGAWLNGFAFNLATRHLRAKRRRWWQSQADPWAIDCAADLRGKTPEQEAMDRELVVALYRAMDHLNEKNRAVFAMHELEGLGVTEIGAVLKMSPQAVFGRIERAKAEVEKQLRRQLDRVGVVDTAAGLVKEKRS